MKKSISTVVFLSLFLMSLSCFGAETPEQVARNYYAALKEDGYGAIPRFLHPAEAERAKAVLYSSMERDQKLPGESLKDSVFGKSVSFDELRALPADQFLSKVFTALPSELAPDSMIESFEILGNVKEKELTHVLVRLNFRPVVGVSTKLHIITMMPYLGGWKTALPDEFETIFLQIDNAIDRK